MSKFKVLVDGDVYEVLETYNSALGLIFIIWNDEKNIFEGVYAEYCTLYEENNSDYLSNEGLHGKVGEI